MIRKEINLDENKMELLMQRLKEENFSRLVRNLIEEKLNQLDGIYKDNRELFPEFRLIEPNVLEIRTVDGVGVFMDREHALKLLNLESLMVDNGNYYFSVRGKLPLKYFINYKKKLEKMEGKI